MERATAGWTGRSPLRVMELLEGASLRELLQGGRLAEPKAVSYAAAIARGLAAAHDRGIVHRDLKPENILITRDDRAKILDFGLAKTTVVPAEALAHAPTIAATELGVILGTVGYFSPEQARGRPADQYSDIFSFGTVLYEMLSGRRAFLAETAVQTMNAILTEEPPEPADRPIPPVLDRIIRRCLEKNPEQRFRSAHDLAFALEGAAVPGSTTRLDLMPRPPARRRIAPIAVALAVSVAAALGFWAGAKSAEGPGPSFRRLTFQRGTVMSARFAPDGQTVFYGAAWDGNPIRVFSTRLGNAASTALAVPDADVLAISSRGELALSLNRQLFGLLQSRGTLARVSLGGGAPRAIAENVLAADWTSDGRELAVVYAEAGKVRLEFPIGKVLHSGPCVWPRVSPKEDVIAFVTGTSSNPSELWTVDRSGSKKRLASGGRWYTLAWSPDGSEVYFVSDERGSYSLYAVSLDGHRRLVTHFAGPTSLLDIAPDGRMLIATQENRREIIVSQRGGREVNLSWLGGSLARAISPDGQQLLFAENTSEDAGTYTMYLRRIDPPSPAVRLDDGFPLDLSPDGKWVAAIDSEKPKDLLLLPTGAGETRRLSLGLSLDDARWFPDSRRLLLMASEDGRPERSFIVDSAGSTPRALTPEGVLGLAVSPDGHRVAAQDDTGSVAIYSVESGADRTIPGGPELGDIIGWTADQTGLYVAEEERTRARVLKRDLATGRRELWKEIGPSDTIGLIDRLVPIVTPDGRTYAYTSHRWLGTLYLVEGLK
ncbi:MAG: protein kinase [Acidobacteria bacterium]|nr:protein kinase [Acidobacteriota bacterium]